MIVFGNIVSPFINDLPTPLTLGVEVRLSIRSTTGLDRSL